MQTSESYVNERLDHLGLVAGVCQEIGLAASLDRLAGETKQQVSVGTATVAMMLNGLGVSNRRVYLVPQSCIALSTLQAESSAFAHTPLYRAKDQILDHHADGDNHRHHLRRIEIVAPLFR